MSFLLKYHYQIVSIVQLNNHLTINHPNSITDALNVKCYLIQFHLQVLFNKTCGVLSCLYRNKKP